MLFFLFALSTLFESEIEPQFLSISQLAARSLGSHTRPSFTTSAINLPEHSILPIDGALIVQAQSSELPFLSWEESEIQIEEGDQGQTTTVFTVQLSQASHQDVTVDYQLILRWHGLDVCCNIERGSVAIQAGQTSNEIHIESIGNTDVGNNQNVFIELQNPRGAILQDGSQTSRALLRIMEDDSTIQQTIRSTYEAQIKTVTDDPYLQSNRYNTLEIGLWRTGNLRGTDVLEVSIEPYGENPADVSDFIGGFSTQKITFNPGESHNISTDFIISKDFEIEGKETFVVTYRLISGSSSVPPRIIYTIDDEFPFR